MKGKNNIARIFRSIDLAREADYSIIISNFECFWKQLTPLQVYLKMNPTIILIILYSIISRISKYHITTFPLNIFISIIRVQEYEDYKNYSHNKFTHVAIKILFNWTINYTHKIPQIQCCLFVRRSHMLHKHILSFTL